MVRLSIFSKEVAQFILDCDRSDEDVQPDSDGKYINKYEQNYLTCFIKASLDACVS